MSSSQSKIKVASKTIIKTEPKPCNFKTQVISEPILMEIVFGRPSKDCRDIGICRASLLAETPQISKQPCDCEEKVIATVKQKRNGQLAFRFPKNQINPKTKITQFANDQFTVPEPFILPESLQRLFCPRLLIEAGVYPITDEGDSLLIEM